MYPLSKKKPKFEDEWKVEGNALLDSAIHFLGTIDQVPLIFKTNNVERMRISSNGNIGIGTFNPVYPFHVEVPSFIRNLLSEHLHVTHHLSVGPLRISKGIGCVTDTLCTDVARDLWMQGRVVQWRADTVKVAPQVGGITAQVEILGQLTTQDLFLKSDSVQPGRLLMVDSAGQVVSAGWDLARNIVGGACANVTVPMSDNWFHGFADAPPFPVNIDPTTTIHLPIETGRVGIGVCVPVAILHVHANSSNYPTFLAEGFGGNLPGYKGLKVDWDGRVGVCREIIGKDYDAQHRLTLDVCGDARFSALNNSKRYIRIGYDGANGLIEFFSDKQGEALLFNYYSGRNIGLGDSSSMVGVPGQLIVGNAASLPNMAGYKLGVGGNAYINGIAMGYNGYDGFIEYGGSGSLLINYTSQKPITLGGVNTTVSVPGTLAVGGVVGIGTPPNPNYALSVCGVIRSKEWIVEANWCDYVFDSTYQRPSWREIAQYCKEHQHLPKVPAAKEVKEQGLPMSKAMEGILFNVELNRLDITQLYEVVIQLQKRIEALEKENEYLRHQLEQLKN